MSVPQLLQTLSPSSVCSGSLSRCSQCGQTIPGLMAAGSTGRTPPYPGIMLWRYTLVNKTPWVLCEQNVRARGLPGESPKLRKLSTATLYNYSEHIGKVSGKLHSYAHAIQDPGLRALRLISHTRVKFHMGRVPRKSPLIIISYNDNDYLMNNVKILSHALCLDLMNPHVPCC